MHSSSMREMTRMSKDWWTLKKWYVYCSWCDIHHHTCSHDHVTVSSFLPPTQRMVASKVRHLEEKRKGVFPSDLRQVANKNPNLQKYIRLGGSKAVVGWWMSIVPLWVTMVGKEESPGNRTIGGYWWSYILVVQSCICVLVFTCVQASACWESENGQPWMLLLVN